MRKSIQSKIIAFAITIVLFTGFTVSIYSGFQKNLEEEIWNLTINIATATIISILLASIAAFYFSKYIINQAVLKITTESQEELIQAKKEAEIGKKSQSDFLTVMTHELRTPLNSIIGFTSCLLEGFDGEILPEQRKSLSKIAKSSNHLLDLINDCLDTSQFEMGKFTLHSEEFLLMDCVQEALKASITLAEKKNLNIKTNFASSLPEKIISDKKRLLQVIENLLNNAVKFTEQGEITLELYGITKEKETHQLQIKVKDSGIGIPEDKIPGLFTPFSLVDSSLTRKYGGSGLGLSICKKISKMMHGDISVESEEGKGSTFYFTFEVQESKSQGKLEV